MKLSISKTLRKILLEMAYPTSFNMEEFKSLTSFNARINYCQKKLERISSGSTRIVYKIDNEKVLKLAKNKRGLGQNEVEIMYGTDSYLSDTVARVYEYDEENFLWLEMELAHKLSKPQFLSITGFNFNDYIDAINYYGVNSGNGGYDSGIDKDLYDNMWEEEFIYTIFTYIGSYHIPVGDLTKLNSYGVVLRDGIQDIVLIDYGLNNDVIATHYS